MNETANWAELEKTLVSFPKFFSLTNIVQARELFGAETASSARFVLYDEKDPLNWLPYDVQESLKESYYETGKNSLMQKYTEHYILRDPNRTQKTFNDLYHFATRTHSHALAWNTLVVLSQLPYEHLGTWADMLAVAATRSPLLDIQEMGIRCFENWGSISACEFLENCHFTEKWLQEYANEVCAYIHEEGIEKNVLSQKNYSWEMAERRVNSTSDSERCSSGYSFCGADYRSEQVVCVES